tara:strand:- start:6791 stop:6982 length:192 start_codon:yes stop_codon:yes gene_type:complete
MDLQQWKQLPLMMSRSDLYLCGLTKNDVQALVEEGLLTPWKKKDDAYAKYRKTEVAKIVGLPV